MTDFYKNYNKKKIFCCNCGKYGHKYSKCNDPITSIGIIAIKIDDSAIFNNFIKYFDKDHYFNLVKSNTINNNILLKTNEYIDKFKFLMIRRKKTLGYIEYIRGRYDEDNIYTYTLLFEQMTLEEMEDIKNKPFCDLWQNLWQKNADNKFYKTEFDKSKNKHEALKENIDFNNYLDNIKINYNQPEWGFPKGRRAYLEKNLACACREFEEETSLKKADYSIINNIPYIQEVFHGTDSILYKHVYYFALCKPNVNVCLDNKNLNQMEEIGDIGWFNYSECRSLIRTYHSERQKILNETFLFLSSIIENKFNINLSIMSDKLLDNYITNNIKKNYNSSDDDDDDDDEDDDDYNDGRPYSENNYIDIKHNKSDDCLFVIDDI